MQIHYARHLAGNFGDELNPWLWPRVLSRPPDACLDDDTMLVGIGSVLNSRIPSRPRKKIVLGSGIGYGPLAVPTPDWLWLCVRGPRSRDALRLPPETALGDTAVLIREFFACARGGRTQAAFMPHLDTSFRGDWRTVCDSTGILYIDPTGAIGEVIGAIAQSRLLVTESLHGAIVADALRVPWIPVRTNAHVLELKWHDWSESVGMRHAFVEMPGIASPYLPRRIRGAVREAVRMVCRSMDRPRLERRIYGAALGFGWKRVRNPSLAGQRLLEIARSGLERKSGDAAFDAMYRGVMGAVQNLEKMIGLGAFPAGCEK